MLEVGEPEEVPNRFIRKGLYHENSTNSRVRLPYNHGKKSWDKFVLLTLFLHTHTHSPTPNTHTHTHTHTPAKQSLANAPRLAQPLPLPKMWAILHQRMLERVPLLVQTSVVKYIH